MSKPEVMEVVPNKTVVALTMLMASCKRPLHDLSVGRSFHIPTTLPDDDLVAEIHALTADVNGLRAMRQIGTANEEFHLLASPSAERATILDQFHAPVILS